MVEEFRLRGTVISARHIEEREHQPTRPRALRPAAPPPLRPSVFRSAAAAAPTASQRCLPPFAAVLPRSTQGHGPVMAAVYRKSLENCWFQAQVCSEIIKRNILQNPPRRWRSNLMCFCFLINDIIKRPE